MGKKDYSARSGYHSRPYQALYISDDEEQDDEICVWKDEPELSDYYDSEDEPLAGHIDHQDTKEIDSTEKAQRAEKTETAEIPTTIAAAPPNPTKGIEGAKVADISPNDIDPKTGKLSRVAFREREIQYALSTTRRNLTHMSQFLLKLEARAGKATKEGIRQTLDATVRDLNYDFKACSNDADHKSEIEEIKHLSGELYNRLYLIDRHWRRISRESRNLEGRSPEIGILSEFDIREWIKVELKTTDLSAEETCFYTVRDLGSNRSFRDWISYLQQLCKFSDHHSDQLKLIELAWRFLDRNLRGPRPVNPTSVDEFIAELNANRKSGVWDEVLKNPKKQEVDDIEAWRTMRKYWSSRTAPG
ncbi:hypothetical protein NUW58_g2347 [Xylaria curta]|uniref:Uncharacterized protein n=1 Tax=Xylaria curta TaxID=42375 RepID=A0ACC1PFZ0_9PEZI|nr:hypothetical protein NUW58_g2347 [Xylaria curta]